MPQTIKYSLNEYEFCLELNIGGLTSREAKEILAARLAGPNRETGAEDLNDANQEVILDAQLRSLGVTMIELTVY
ncbi:hypothetical protein [Pseudomonas luteola]|uniref:Uncharacterized protein n=1 Tax=Pseudomonas luteola TaxID=47886 RepID=A0A2X2BYY2_PSELU|nr:MULTISPECIES: hypothetical protein [Pseudomonas]SHJ42637.1 hypothetical protein SAMN05216295_11392 [Pseudomonas zeshuii]SPZ00213.1 Uncharacterised protein [Pseudomonas luteola]